MRTLIPALATLVVLSQPLAAQDLLKPLEDLVEQMLPQPAAPPPSPRPQPRPAPQTAETPVQGEVDAPLPRKRPEPEPEPEPEVARAGAPPAAEPEPEPDRVYQSACPAVVLGLVEAEALPPLSEGACGERSPLSVTAVLVRGRMLPLSNPVVTSCAMAVSLPGWLETVDGYAGAMLESELAGVITGTGYTCRKRNGAATGFTSEHGFANALDVVGFTLADGRSVAVEGNWLPAAAPAGRLLRLAHDAACSGFTTVLGPEANAEHEDHLHLDMGCHGQTCTARICE